MKIALIYPNLVINGGGPRQVLSLARELTRMGHQATLFTYRYDPGRCYPELSREVEIRAVDRTSGSLASEKAHWLWRRRKAWYRSLLETPAVAQLVQERFDVLNPHERPAHQVAVQVKRKLSIPIVWMYNDPTSWESGSYRSWMPPRALEMVRVKWMRAWERHIVCHVDAVAVLDHRVQKIFHRAFDHAPHVVRTGLDTEFLRQPTCSDGLRTRLCIPASSALILFVGILMRHRRVEDLLAATRLLRVANRDVKLVILGARARVPEYFDFLKAEAHRLGIADDVIFVPENVSEEELRAYYQACDIFVFPNEAQTWGLAPLEAMACGKPAIVSTGAGVHEVLEDGETALLVPPRSPERIATAVGALQDDPALYRRLAERGKRFVLDELSWRQYAEQMLTIFHQVIAAQASKVIRSEVS